MKLQINTTSEQIELLSNFLNVVVIENKKLFYEVSYSISNDNEDEYFSLFDDKDKKFYDLSSKAYTIPNIFCFDMNSKKNLNVLFKKFIKVSNDDDHIDERNLNREIGIYINNLIFDSDFDLEFDEITQENILKVSNLRFKISDNLQIFERIKEYIFILQRLFEKDIFLFVNLIQILDLTDLEMLLYETNLAGIKIIDIENKIDSSYFNKHNVYLIDESLCTFYSNNVY